MDARGKTEGDTSRGMSTNVLEWQKLHFDKLRSLEGSTAIKSGTDCLFRTNVLRLPNVDPCCCQSGLVPPKQEDCPFFGWSNYVQVLSVSSKDSSLLLSVTDVHP